MDLNPYDFDLPPELIAQHPAEQRDHSRLMHLRPGDRPVHLRFDSIVDLLRKDDVLVLNRTKVVPARLFGRKASGGKVELLLIDPPTGAVTADPLECLIRGGRIKPGAVLEFNFGLTGRVVETMDHARRLVSFSAAQGDWVTILTGIGGIPLPPYIKRDEPPRTGSWEARRYQTVYAEEPGAAAAPTAGLHFTPELLDRIRRRGVEIAPLTLHVGLGTFEPLREEHIKTGRLHRERYVVSPESARLINEAKQGGRRIVAVGTTSVRLLEHAGRTGEMTAGTGWTDLFIRPGFDFKMVGAMVTNFHLPGSSLMMLVSALVGRENIMAAYAEAIEERYRFFSFGDAMFLERE